MTAELIQLSEVAGIAKGPIRPDEFPDEVFSLHSIPAYDEGEPTLTEGKEIRSSKTLIQKGDVLVSKLNPRIPRVWHIAEQSQKRMVCSTEFIPFRVKDPAQLDSEYLGLMMRAPQFMGELAAMVRSSTRSHQRVRPDDIAVRGIPLPDLAEQRRIVARIKECMERVDEIETLRAETQIERGALSSSLIESEIRSRDDVVELPVGSLVTKIRNGRSIVEDSTGKADGTVLTLTSVRSINLGMHYRKPIVLSEQVYRQYSIQADDVFVSRANTIELVGLSAVAVCSPPERIIYPDLLIKLHVDQKKITPRYLTYALRSSSARRQIKNRALGSSQTMVKISGERLREIVIPVPDIDAQERIVERLDAAHSLVDQLSAELAEEPVSTLRESILRKAFAGEL